MSSITLAMIARDEEGWIAQAILSVRPIVSQIVLVDTGSLDRTVKIASELGAEVYHQPWQDDFSLPRNLSLERATGDWILVLDADEAIAEEDLPKLELMSADRSICWEFLQRHYTDDQRLSNFEPVKGQFPRWEAGHGGYFESNCVRMFPNHEGIVYRGRIHELVEPSIKELGKHRVVRTNVRIHHYGHTRKVKAAKNKGALYTPLGMTKTAERPDDWKAFYELGVEHNGNGRLAESEAALQKAAELNPSHVPTWINLGYVRCELGRYEEAISDLQTAIRLDPVSAEAHCNLGVVHLRQKDYRRAEMLFRRALSLKPDYVNAYCNLAVALSWLNRLAEAANIYQRAIEIFPNCAAAHADLGALYLQAGVLRSAEKHLRKALELDTTLSRAKHNLAVLEKASTAGQPS